MSRTIKIPKKDNITTLDELIDFLTKLKNEDGVSGDSHCEYNDDGEYCSFGSAEIFLNNSIDILLH